MDIDRPDIINRKDANPPLPASLRQELLQARSLSLPGPREEPKQGRTKEEGFHRKINLSISISNERSQICPSRISFYDRWVVKETSCKLGFGSRRRREKTRLPSIASTVLTILGKEALQGLDDPRVINFYIRRTFLVFRNWSGLWPDPLSYP